MNRSFKKTMGSRRGNAMIEFALASAFLIPIFLGTFQFGYAFYVYNLLATQVRAGARYASMRTFRCVDQPSIDHYKLHVRNMVRYGNPDGTGNVIEPGLTDAQVDVQIKGKNDADARWNNPPDYVTVSTTGYALDAVIKTFTFTGKPVVRFPYVGIYSPASTEP